MIERAGKESSPLIRSRIHNTSSPSAAPTFTQRWSDTTSIERNYGWGDWGIHICSHNRGWGERARIPHRGGERFTQAH